MKTVYLDNAATTPVRGEVVEAMLPYLSGKYGNASSLHALGREAREAVEEGRAIIAEELNAEPSEIVFTSGGTESNNLAIKGIAFKHLKTGGHIITSKIEHSSILKPCKWLESRGFEVTYLGVDGHGLVHPSDLAEAIREDTILITIGHANSEIGTIQDIKDLGKVAAENGIPLHTDACQSFMKTDIDAKSMGLGLATINAHKINGPKGVGALFVRKGSGLTPQNLGGEQEFRQRAGTENVAGIVGFAKAAQLMTENDITNMKGLRDRLINGVLNGIGNVRLNGHPTQRLCNNANFTFKGVEGEALLLRLDMKGIYVSTGSACSSQSLEPSHVITAIGLRPEESHGSIRMTVGWDNTGEQIEYALESIRGEVENLRKISPVWG